MFFLIYLLIQLKLLVLGVTPGPLWALSGNLVPVLKLPPIF